MKAAQRGKFITLSSHTSSSAAHLKALEQEEADSPRRSRYTGNNQIGNGNLQNRSKENNT